MPLSIDVTLYKLIEMQKYKTYHLSFTELTLVLYKSPDIPSNWKITTIYYLNVMVCSKLM